MPLNLTNWAFNVSNDYRATIRAVKSCLNFRFFLFAVGMVIKQIRQTNGINLNLE